MSSLADRGIVASFSSDLMAMSRACPMDLGLCISGDLSMSPVYLRHWGCLVRVCRAWVGVMWV